MHAFTQSDHVAMTWQSSMTRSNDAMIPLSHTMGFAMVWRVPKSLPVTEQTSVFLVPTYHAGLDGESPNPNPNPPATRQAGYPINYSAQNHEQAQRYHV